MKSKGMMILVCALTAGMIVCGCGANNADNSGSSTDSEVASEVSNEALQSETSAPPNSIVIETPYGDLYYPDQWTEHVQIEQVELEDGVEVTFTAIINESQYPLFTVIVGESDSTKVGELTDSSGTSHGVYIQLEEIPEDSALSEGEQNRLYAMQEDLNYLIDHLE